MFVIDILFPPDKSSELPIIAPSSLDNSRAGFEHFDEFINQNHKELSKKLTPSLTTTSTVSIQLDEKEERDDVISNSQRKVDEVTLLLISTFPVSDLIESSRSLSFFFKTRVIKGYPMIDMNLWHLIKTDEQGMGVGHSFSNLLRLHFDKVTTQDIMQQLYLLSSHADKGQRQFRAVTVFFKSIRDAIYSSWLFFSRYVDSALARLVILECGGSASALGTLLKLLQKRYIKNNGSTTEILSDFRSLKCPSNEQFGAFLKQAIGRKVKYETYQETFELFERWWGITGPFENAYSHLTTLWKSMLTDEERKIYQASDYEEREVRAPMEHLERRANIFILREDMAWICRSVIIMMRRAFVTKKFILDHFGKDTWENITKDLKTVSRKNMDTKDKEILKILLDASTCEVSVFVEESLRESLKVQENDINGTRSRIIRLVELVRAFVDMRRALKGLCRTNQLALLLAAGYDLYSISRKTWIGDTQGKIRFLTENWSRLLEAWGFDGSGFSRPRFLGSGLTTPKEQELLFYGEIIQAYARIYTHGSSIEDAMEERIIEVVHPH